MRIATKLMVGSTVGMLLVLAVHALVTFRRESRLILEESRETGERLAHGLALAMGREWDLDGQAAAASLIREVDERYPDISFRWQREGATSALDAASLSRLSDGQPVSVLDGETGQLSSLFLVSGGTDRGVVSVTQNMKLERQRVRASMVNLGIAVLAILLLNAVLAMVLSRRWVASPLEKLFEMARDVGAGNLDARVSLPVSAVGEFVALGDALNEMGAQLGKSRAERDATERKRRETEQQLRHAERLTTVGRLASGVAHEIGTPLNVITGNAAMIFRGQVSGDGAVKSATTIATHADRITAIVKQLLGFARRQGAKKADADLAKLCRETLSMLAPFARKGGVELLGPAEGAAHTAPVDVNQITQVITNLVMNGIHASSKGQELSVSVDTVTATPPADSGSTQDRFVRIDVRDHGSGVAAENLAHVFEPFFTTKDVGEGTGLGLSVVHGIVHDHGGWIGLESASGVGSTFSVFLPVGEQ